ncbi:methionine biosynthesis protein MetW [Melaminivora alkalimesophila]|uniref:Methionine biosynthesis protein MetW n=2 Tax=Melaminivora alkalimesophila TaxID=1165852 RepID=A0A317R9F0_9BURK|nr:methyltransferase domain-containing protein [Melaminivora alkalimesophila]PWW43735.1 methionine biosynthesis protein MetW [Melaminivora alkalimesophila]
MTQNIEDLHVYLRSIRPGERTSLSVLAGLVHEGATVLDLGCGSGALGQYLKETRGCTSDGLTWSEAEAAHARPHYRHVVVADLEACDLLAAFDAQHYDYVVCADVLEHLRAPERVLAACRELLRPGTGQLLVSVPNAGYAGLVAELLQGEFRYREEGLLDRTHLRFFTRRSLARFLGEQRWALRQIDTIRRELPESEFQARFDELPPAVARYLLAAPDALAYQFIGAAQPVAHAVSAPREGAPDPEPAHALFTAQLYVARGQGYTEDGKRSATGQIGRERQTLRFELPAGDAPLTAIRLDPADRPGFFHLHALRLLDGAGQPLWQWSALQAERSLLATTAHQQIVWHAPAASPTLLLLTGDDPWFELPAPADALAQAAVLEAEVGWPMSADYLALSASVQPLHDRIGQLLERQQHMDNLARALEESRAQAQRLQAQSDGFQSEAAQLQRNATQLQHELTRLQSDYGELAAHLKAIESSTVFRATRPLVHAKMTLDRLLGRTPKHLRAAARPAPRPLQPPDQPVDIIVPVYRGLEDTRLCIESVLAAPVRTPWRLIVINDCSPEPEVTAWLRERAAQDSRITLLENEDNLGFVGTVNRGMALSQANDVLLLNSDTEVANDWLDRIRAAAYGDARVASVTPLSTNATICSYPRFCEDNPLPPGWDTARLDALAAATLPGAVVDVPTGVGFCMYIRRDCLEAVGLFDTENFGKGYGEENDFCQRAARAGWRNLHLLDTFVLHTGGVSFGDAKSPRERAAMQTLARLHPNYARDVHAFVQEDPARPFRLALDAARIQSDGPPVVLAVLHDRAGGTVRHVRELAEHLRGRAQFLTLSPAPGQSVLLRMADEGEAFALSFRLADQWDELLDVLRALGVCHVHYHHLLGHGQQVRELPALLDVPYDFTAHDYFSYCTHITLTGDDGRYAGEPALGQCACCAPAMAAPQSLPGVRTVAEWRGANARLLAGARHVLAPSRDAARRIAAFAPAARVRAVPHTDIVPGAALPEPAPRPLQGGRPLKVAVIGALSAIKGADVLEAAALAAARRGAPVEFHLLGYGYRHLRTQPRARLTVYGEYQEADLSGLLDWLQPDLVWFPAQWPETYSYTLSAALQAGLPVAVPDLGAFAERVAGRAWSWVCPWGQDGNAWVDFFTELRERHFIPAVPPALPGDPLPDFPQGGAPWDYGQDYLVGLPSMAPGAPQATPLDASALARWLPEPTAAEAARSGAVAALAWLRSLPGLRGVAQRIPPHVQRRVKSWLQR